LREAGQVTGAPTTGTNNPCGLNRGLGRIEAHGLTLDNLAAMIGSPNGFNVIDKTGLKGPYDWELVLHARPTSESSTGPIFPSGPEWAIDFHCG
jgi:uncharacterized protein (TIGR03435 family)